MGCKDFITFVNRKNTIKNGLLSILLIICFLECKSQSTEKPTNTKKQNFDTALENYVKASTEKEKKFAEKQTDNIGELVTSVAFKVKTKNKKDFKDGIIPWASIEKPENDLPNLINKDDIIIQDSVITIMIDYPLANKYQFKLVSKNGFTRAMLLREISKNYYKIYKEEEETATVKILPPKERKIYNRNETNGKYGVWGHDIADLVLAGILVYKTQNNRIVLSLNIES